MKRGAFFGAAAARPEAAGAFAADSMSFLMMRPPGPEPRTCDSSMPRSDAIRRASGEDFARFPSVGAEAAEWETTPKPDDPAAGNGGCTIVTCARGGVGSVAAG